MKTPSIVCCSFVFAVILTSTHLHAQIAPGVAYVFPPAIERGQTTNVKLGGYDFTPDLQFFVHDKSIDIKTAGELSRFFVPEPPYWFGLKGYDTAFPIPREVSGQLTVKSDHLPGFVNWQVANANGASKTGVFFVSDHKEVVESRWRDHDVQVLDQLPIGVSGRIRKISEVDQYQFLASKNGPVTLNLMARRLGANFSAVIEVRDDAGNMIADAADTEGRDIAITFAAKAQKNYVVRVFDLDFRGNRVYVYRLSISETPRVVATKPAFGKAGETRPVEFIGHGISSGSDRLESIRANVAFNLAQSRITTGQRRVLPYVLKTKSGDVLVEIPISEQSELIDAKGVLAIPSAVTSSLAKAGEIDRYKFKAAKGDAIMIKLQSQEIGTRLDMALEVQDASGKVIAKIDDAKGTSDANVLFRAKLDGEYTCVVRDASGRAGQLDSVYRLSLEPDLVPGFSLTCVQSISSAIPGKATLKVTAIRTGDFTGEIPIQVLGLPAGISAPAGLKILEKKKDVSIAIDVAAGSATQAALIQVKGSATIAGKKVERFAIAPAAGNLCPARSDENLTPFVMLATTMKPPFSVLLVDRNRQRAVNRGTTYPAPFQIQRDENFKGEIILEMAAKQSRHRQGITGPIMTIAKDQKEALYPCFMPEWLATDRTTRMQVMGVAQVADPKGKLRYLTKNADARITMILEGRLMKVAQQSNEITISPGTAFEVPVSVLRTSQFQQPVKIELVVPKELEQHITASPVEIGVDSTASAMSVKTTNDPRLVGDWSVTIKCTGIQDGKWPVVSQTELPLRFVAAAK
jgi:hypothetical protein